MPELPEVETLAVDLRRLLTGAEFANVEVLWPKSVAMPAVDEFVRQVPGRKVLDVSRRGKFLVLSLSGPSFLLIHLRMSGHVRVEPTTEPVDGHARLIFHLSDGRRLLFSDPRKFGRVYWTTDLNLVLGDLGPEPLSADFTAQDFVKLLSAHRGVLKPLLLNQTVLAGLGNIYTDEALFAASLHPLRKASTLSAAEGERLYWAIREVLQQAIHNRGTTLTDERFRDAEGRPGSHAQHLCVYRRVGEPCPRCGTPIERITVGNRGTHFCPRCQC
nr:bifunctional DNA-formamidopyrimidine glycosylase/DNA-(apurinic or apyrimidinic site) lyase [Chloroflexota bacterium]